MTWIEAHAALITGSTLRRASDPDATYQVSHGGIHRSKIIPGDARKVIGGTYWGDYPSHWTEATDWEVVPYELSHA